MTAKPTENENARRWRERHGWSWTQLGSYIGYSRETIYWMERGCTSKRLPIPAHVWHRYKMACAGLEAQMRSQKIFEW